MTDGQAKCHARLTKDKNGAQAHWLCLPQRPTVEHRQKIQDQEAWMGDSIY